jgi:hypothetical protein
MTIDVAQLGEAMAKAALDVLKGKAPQVVAFAKPEFAKLGLTIASIERELLAGEITVEQARLLLDMQKNASRTVMLAVEGIGLLAAEAAINAALAVARPIVNAALGVALL